MLLKLCAKNQMKQSPSDVGLLNEVDLKSADRSQSQRLMSLDALRGFDMALIVGLGTVLDAVANSISPEAGHWMEIQTEHPKWNGYTAWDQIFPMFMFLAGVAMPFALSKRIERGQSKWRLHWQVVRRGLLLVLLGMIYNGLLRFDFEHMRYCSVLGRIGLGYLFAGLIVLNSGLRGQIISIALLLVGYCAAMLYIPAGEFGAGDLTPGHTLSGYIDRMVVPGVMYKGVRDPEGLFSTIPAIATVLTGVLTGHWLRRNELSGHVRASVLLIAGALSIGAALLWNPWFPINKNLWSSSFVLLTSGVSAVLLAAFYWVIDVCGFRRWAFFFVVIGMNAITIYLLGQFVDFGGVGNTIFAAARNSVHPAIYSAVPLLTGWLLLFAMYRAKIFLRV